MMTIQKIFHAYFGSRICLIVSTCLPVAGEPSCASQQNKIAEVRSGSFSEVGGRLRANGHGGARTTERTMDVINKREFCHNGGRAPYTRYPAERRGFSWQLPTEEKSQSQHLERASPA